MNKFKYCLLNIILGVSIYLFASPISADSENDLMVLGWCCCLQFGLALYSWKKLTNTIFSPYIAFLVAAYIFTAGHLFLYAFQLDFEVRGELRYYSIQQTYTSLVITLLFLSNFHIGAILSYRLKATNFVSIGIMEKQRKALKNVGWFLLGISVVPFIYTTAQSLIISSTRGYTELYYQEKLIGISNIVKILSGYFMPSILCLFFAYSRDKKKLRYIYVAFGIYILPGLLIGGRGGAVVSISIILLMRHYLIKPIKGVQLLSLVGISLVLLFSLSLIAELRSSSSKSISAFSSAAKEKTLVDGVIDTFAEMGGSLHPLVATVKLTDGTEPFRFGSSYLYAASSIIPNLGFWDLHPAMKYGNLGDWLMKKESMTYGPGYSITAEAYLNFGIYGFVIMLIWGYLFAQLLAKADDYRVGHNLLLLFISILFSFLVISIVRNSFLSTVRALVYHVLPIYLYVNYYTKRKTRNRL